MFTLQRRGELRAPNGDPDLQRELDKYIPYEYIIRWFQTHEGRTGIENRFLAIQSGTASGKTITIPAKIYDSLVRSRYVSGGGIICTQPRVLTTIDSAKRISKIPEYSSFLKLGETVGWSTQFSKLKPRRIGLLFATLGVLTMQLQIFTDAEIMALYRFIIIDEAHERSLGADMAFASLKSFLQRNAHLPSCPFVIVMSATIDTAKYARYFLTPLRSDDKSPTVIDNIIICNAAPSQERRKEWPPGPITNIIEESVRIVEHIMDSYPAPPETWKHIRDAKGIEVARVGTMTQTERDDILIFFPGNAEISKAYIALAEMNRRRTSEKKTTVSPVILTGPSVAENTEDVVNLDVPLRTISHQHDHERRVILSTNVAETGKTFNTLRYVIDAGYNRENEYNPNLKVEVLLSKPAPVSRIMQRWGRVGRLFPGVIYPLYPEDIFAKLQKDQYPSIITSNMTPIILQIVFDQQKMKSMNSDRKANAPYFRVADMDMMDPPPPDILLDSLDRANVLGFIAHGPTEFAIDIDEFLNSAKRADDNLVGITKLGRVAMELTSVLDSAESIRMILAGFSWGYRAADLIAIAAFMSLEPRREKSEENAVNLSNPAKLTNQRKSEINICRAYQEVFPARADGDGDTGLSAMTAWHIALGDTFFDGLIVSTAIDDIFSSVKENETFANLLQWCSELNITFESLMHFIEVKDNICSALLTLGFDIYRGVSIIDIARAQYRDPETLANAIVRYKRCIFEGYRLNIVNWDDNEQTYRTFTGLHVPPGFVEKKFALFSGKTGNISRPRTIVFDEFKGVINPKMTYDIIAGQMTILDGFVGYDPLFAQ